MKRDIIEALEGNILRPPKHDTESYDEQPSFPLIVAKDPIESINKKDKIEDIDNKQDVKDDYTYARKISLNLLDQQQELIKSMVHFLNVCPSARGYEVINRMISDAQSMCGNMLTMQKQLQELQANEKLEELIKKNAEEPKTLPQSTSQVFIFSGPTEALDALDQKIIDIKPENDET